MIITISILSSIILILIVILILYIKNYNGMLDLNLSHEDKFKTISTRIEFCSRKLKEIDLTGHFETDDEVGFFFNELKHLQLLLDEFNILYYGKEDTDYAKQLNTVLSELRNLKETDDSE